MLDESFIRRKLALVGEELKRLKEFENDTIDDLARDWRSQATAERLLERTFMRAIDINEHLIAERGARLKFPRRYRETFLLLAELNVYPRQFAEAIAGTAQLRNALVHDYSELDPNIRGMRIGKLIELFNEYTKYALAFIEKEA